jgi:hypothetical protein
MKPVIERWRFNGGAKVRHEKNKLWKNGKAVKGDGTQA